MQLPLNDGEDLGLERQGLQPIRVTAGCLTSNIPVLSVMS